MQTSLTTTMFWQVFADCVGDYARAVDAALAEYKYSADQPRVPAGSPEGGQ